VSDPARVLVEMRGLFGDDLSGEILSRETSLQATFNVKTDAAGAKLWPCIPISLGR
jgi:hypothetical protein